MIVLMFKKGQDSDSEYYFDYGLETINEINIGKAAPQWCIHEQRKIWVLFKLTNPLQMSHVQLVR